MITAFPAPLGPHTWPHGHGPENHPELSIGSQLGRVATGSVSPVAGLELWGVTGG